MGDNDIETCEVCLTHGSATNMLDCAVCSDFYCLTCVEPPMSSVPSGRWLCPECDGHEQDRNASTDHEHESLTSETDDDSISCEACGRGRDVVLVCFKCKTGYHPTCLDRPRFPIPGGRWYCPACDTACEVCRGTDDVNMLLCDGYLCDRGYHCCCLKPPLLTLPAEHEKWFCPQCESRRASKGKRPQVAGYKGANDVQAHASKSAVSSKTFRQSTLPGKLLPGAVLPI